MKKIKPGYLIRMTTLLYNFFSGSRISLSSKLLVILAMLYIISPFDLIPDWIIIAGWLEDIVIGVLTVNFIKNKMADVKKKQNPEDSFNKNDAIDVEAKVITKD